MATHRVPTFSSPLFLVLQFLFFFLSPTLSKKSTFIIHLSKSHELAGFASAHDWHSSILHSLQSGGSDLDSDSDSDTNSKILYSYVHAATGFAAHISAHEAAELRRHPFVVSVMPDKIGQMDTTYTPQFMGLNDWSGLWPSSNYGSEVIIGVVDSGIWPGHPSFNDTGYGPVPSTWKGLCEVGPNFPASACNRKVIGARIFYAGYEIANGAIPNKSARDETGHGTHCASIAAGSSVRNAGFYQYAQGEARGMAKKARIAVYKVLWQNGCVMSDVMAAMEQALADGVHILSISISANSVASDYFRDSLAIAAFRATERGVLVSTSASNVGPTRSSAKNIAPWIFTVGSSTLPRWYPATIVLGNGRTFSGTSLWTGANVLRRSLVNGVSVGSRFCRAGELISSLISGRIVVCDRENNVSPVITGHAVQQAGGAGMILLDFSSRGQELAPELFLNAAIKVTVTVGNQIKNYIAGQTNPTASLNFLGSNIGGEPSAPRVARSSARGPNRVTPEILKPDIIAPGVSVLAGWTGFVGPTRLNIDPRRVQFNFLSGTSMSCPHVSGLAALLRNAYPDWSPAAIRSALMTTAYDMDNSRQPIKEASTGQICTPFDYGSGHVNPNLALNPGLVYDLETKDYIAFLCSIGYSHSRISILVSDPTQIDCRANNLSSPGDLNYPSFSVVFKNINDVMRTYTRRVKNVGTQTNTTYTVDVVAPENVVVIVSPRILEFSSQKQTLSYTIRFRDIVAWTITPPPSFGYIQWSNGIHTVKSPFAVSWNNVRNQQDLIASI